MIEATINAAFENFDEQRANEKAMGTHFQMRTEFRGDCVQILALLKPWLVSWMESSGGQTDDSYTDSNGKIWSSLNWGMDTDVQFILRVGSPHLNEIRWLISTIVDCHVAAQTVEHASNYTDERIDPDVFAELAALPPADVIQLALESVLEIQDCHESRGETSARTAERLKAHLGDSEPYMRRVARGQAQALLEHVFDDGYPLNQLQLAALIYEDMTFDSNGAHIHLRTKVVALDS
jgi:hypothetical protein